MSLQSPGLEVNELDLSVLASNTGTTNAAFGGRFNKGYAGKVVNVNNVNELIDNFGKPDNLNFNQWFQAYYYLQYSSGLYISRAVDENGHWRDPENEVDKVTNIGKVQIKGNPTNILKGNIVKFSQDSEDEYTIKDIETPYEGKKAAGEIEILQSMTGEFAVTINGTRFSVTAQMSETRIEVAQKLSNAIDMPGIITDYSLGNKVFIEHVNPGVELVVQVGNPTMLNYTQTQAPEPVEGYELVFDDETDFSTIVNPGDKIFVKGFSGNSFKFAPKEPTSAELDKNPNLANLRPLSANEQVPYEDLYMNEDVYDTKSDSIAFPDNYVLKVMARTFGKHGDDIKVCIAREADFNDPTSQCFTGIPLNSQFDFKPLESKKEIALLVMVDKVIVEKYILSLDRDARDYQNRSMFIDDVIRRKSSVVYVKTNTAIQELPKSCVKDDVLTLTNGNDGEIGVGEITTAYGSVSDGLGFGDVESLPLDYIISNEEARNAAGALAVARGDCIAFHGAKFDIVGQKTTKCVELMLEDVNTGEMNGGDTRNSYNAYYGNYAMIFDSFNDKYRWINIAGMIAGARAKTTSETYAWYASAGESQGQLIGITKLAFTPNVGARDKMYVSQINPVTSFPGRGIQIYGQKTLQAQNSAFSRVNVRLLFNYMKRNLTELLRSYVFQLNDEFTRNSITANCSAFLQRIETLRGIYEFGVKCDDTNNTAQVVDNNELVVDIAVKPARTAEFITLTLMALGSDVSISEVFGG